MRGFLVFALCLAVGVANAPVRAEESMASANSEQQEGVGAYQRGDHELALEHFRKAYELSGKAELLYAMAQSERALGRCQDAILHFEQFIAASSNESQKRAAEANIERCRQTSARTPPPESQPAPVASAAPKPSPVAAQPSPEPVRDGERAEPVPASNRAQVPKRAAADTWSPWYHDALGGTLVATGAALSGIGGLLYWQSGRALDRRDRDAREPERGSYQSNVDKTTAINQQRRTATVLCLGGGVLAALGALRYLSLPGEEEVGIAVGNDGIVARFGGAF
jgi:tetratricopeptide (TPR) repeat protein